MMMIATKTLNENELVLIMSYMEAWLCDMKGHPGELVNKPQSEPFFFSLSDLHFGVK